VRLVGLSVTNFRNFARLTLDFPKPVTLLVGDNAQGKTNLLEAIYYLATSRSPRARKEREVVNWLAFDEPLHFARLVADVVRDNTPLRLEITLVQQNGNAGAARPRFSKQIRINGTNKRALDLVGCLPLVLFLPRDTRLVSGAPSGRRRYLDVALCQMDVSYCRSLAEYDRVLVQRNALLRELRERWAGSGADQLSFWDDQLVALGSLLTVRRASLVVALDEEARQRHRGLSSEREHLQVRYNSGISERLPSAGGQLALDLGQIVPHPALDVDQVADLFRRQLESLRKREIAAGMSLRGPHRDDLHFLSDGRDLRAFGSRGQQRTAALALKLAEVSVMSSELGEPPLLLLDDVMSELDGARRAALLDLLADVTQAIVTATDSEDFPRAFRSRSRHLRVIEGQLEDVDLA